MSTIEISSGTAKKATDSTIQGLGTKILHQLESDLGAIWTERLSQTDRNLVQAVSNDAAMVLVLGLAGPADQAAREKAQLDAQLLNLTSAESARINQQFWASVSVAVKTALSFAISFA
jgi:hypothetical protein